MTLLSHSVPTLTGGVSQLPPASRGSSHMETMENAWPSMTAGLQKRAPLENGGELATPATTWYAPHDPAFHIIDRSPTERYLVGINPRDTVGKILRVWDLNDIDVNGNMAEKVVKMDISGFNYLVRGAADYSRYPYAAEYRFQTIGDVTFIVNSAQDRPVYMNHSYKTPERVPEALIFVKGTNGSVADNVVITFEGHNTPLLSTDGGKHGTDGLASKIHAAISGADSALVATTRVDPKTNKVHCTDPNLEEGTPIKFRVTSWKQTNKVQGGYIEYRWRDYSRRRTTWRYGKIYENSVVYVKNLKKKASSGHASFEISLDAFGPPIDIVAYKSALSYIRVASPSFVSRADYFKFLRVVRKTDQMTYAGGGAQHGNIMYCTHRWGWSFDLQSHDAVGDTLVDIIEHDVSTVAELPNICKEGFHLKIKGGEDSSLDDFYVAFRRTSADRRGHDNYQVDKQMGKGVWEETAKQSLRTDIDGPTSPHLLIREADGNFTFRAAHEHCNKVLGMRDTAAIRVQAAYGTAPTSDKSADDIHLYDDGDEVTCFAWNTADKRDEAIKHGYTKYWVKARANKAQPQSRLYTQGTVKNYHSTAAYKGASYQDIELYTVPPKGTQVGTYPNQTMEWEFDTKWRVAPKVMPDVKGGFPKNDEGNYTLFIRQDPYHKELHLARDNKTLQNVPSNLRWAERRVGDELTNPAPGWVDEALPTQTELGLAKLGKGWVSAESSTPAISDVALFKNRLVFACGENLCFSEYGNFFNFFRTTVTTLIDTDPIDIAATGNRIEAIRRIQPFGDYLLAFTDTTQYVVQAPQGQPFTPATAEIRVATELDSQVSGAAGLVASGDSLYFPTKSADPTNNQAKGDYSGVTEFRAHPQVRGEFMAESVSTHIPRYIPGAMKAMTADEQSGVVAVCGTDPLTSTANPAIHIYKHRDLGGRRLQSAWFTYTFADAFVRHLHFINSYLYVITNRGNDWHVDKMNFGDRLTDSHPSAYADLDYVTYLDRRFSYVPATGSATASTIQTATGDAVPASLTAGRTLIGWEQHRSAGLGEGEIAVPYALTASVGYEVVSMTGERLTIVEVITAGDYANCIVVEGEELDYSGNALWIGEKYTMSCQFSDQHMREPIGQAKFPLSDARLQLRRGSVNYNASAYAKVAVDPERDDKAAFEYEVSNIADRSQGRLVRTNGELRFPIQSKNNEVSITLTNDTPFPSNFTSAEFESTYNRRARRVQV